MLTTLQLGHQVLFANKTFRQEGGEVEEAEGYREGEGGRRDRGERIERGRRWKEGGGREGKREG